jgi:uncharacterized protein YegP (UPF0339 family)
MTRPAQVTQALSAMRNRATGTGRRSEPASSKFLVLEDNTGGGYRWTLVAAGGEHLAWSPRFASYQEATRAARIARAGAASAPIEGRPVDTPLADPAARLQMAFERDHLDAERWLDEGGSYGWEESTRRADR